MSQVLSPGFNPSLWATIVVLGMCFTGMHVDYTFVSLTVTAIVLEGDGEAVCWTTVTQCSEVGITYDKKIIEIYE
jgi:hypothetical protein